MCIKQTVDDRLVFFLNINNWLGLVRVQRSILNSEKNVIVALKRDNLHCIIYYANFTPWNIKLFPPFFVLFFPIYVQLQLVENLKTN